MPASCQQTHNEEQQPLAFWEIDFSNPRQSQHTQEAATIAATSACCCCLCCLCFCCKCCFWFCCMAVWQQQTPNCNSHSQDSRINFSDIILIHLRTPIICDKQQTFKMSFGTSLIFLFIRHYQNRKKKLWQGRARNKICPSLFKIMSLKGIFLQKYLKDEILTPADSPNRA